MKRFHYILLLLTFGCLSGLSAQTVEGTITDKDGFPLIGATVMIKSTGSGTVTDYDGKYSVSAGAGQALIVSYTGYATQEVEVGAGIGQRRARSAADVQGSFL